MLGEYLEENCPDVRVQVIIKDVSEWKPFLDSVCRSYGFYTPCCPIVYTIEGTLIGDGQAFSQYIHERYQKVIHPNQDAQKKRTIENVENIMEKMREKDKGLTLGETIEKQLDKVKTKKGAVTLVDSMFYDKVSQGGLTWYLRQSNFHDYKGRLMDI